MKNFFRKQILSVFCILLATLTIFSFNIGDLKTAALTSGDFIYVLSSNGDAKISSYSGTNARVVIPSAIDGHTVTEIGERAFFHNENLIEVVIPSGVKELEYGAFEWCPNLLSINLPDSVETVGMYAFDQCDSLTDIAL